MKTLDTSSYYIFTNGFMMSCKLKDDDYKVGDMFTHDNIIYEITSKGQTYKPMYPPIPGDEFIYNFKKINAETIKD